jgi:hypothetical protein
VKRLARFVSAAILLAVTTLTTTPTFAQGYLGSGRLGSSSISSTTASTLGQLPLTLVLQQTGDVTYYNQVARSTDLAALSPANSNLASTVKNGKRMVAFASWAAAQAALSGLVGKVDTIGYDPEHWSNTPMSEQNNLVATVQAASALTHTYGFSFFLVPDRTFDRSYGPQLAPYADIYCLQGEVIETNTSQFSQWMTSLISSLWQASAKTKIYVQVSTVRGTPQ